MGGRGGLLSRHRLVRNKVGVECAVAKDDAALVLSVGRLVLKISCPITMLQSSYSKFVSALAGTRVTLMTFQDGYQRINDGLNR